MCSRAKWCTGGFELLDTADDSAQVGKMPTPEFRCGHGFLCSVVPCPEGCKGGGRRVLGRPQADGYSGHPSFVDMKNQICGDWKVLTRGGNDSKGTVCWICRHKCGAIHSVTGTQLRHKPPKYCPTCRPAKFVPIGKFELRHQKAAGQ